MDAKESKLQSGTDINISRSQALLLGYILSNTPPEQRVGTVLRLIRSFSTAKTIVTKSCNSQLEELIDSILLSEIYTTTTSKADPE